MKQTTIEQDGDYHVKFRGITKEQSSRIENDDSIARCQWTDSAEGGFAEVIFLKTDDSIFPITQELAKKAGMGKIPAEEQTEYLPDGGKLEYDIVYHYDLLELYGVSNPDSMGISAYKVGTAVLIMLCLVFAAFIYNFFEISLYESRRYLGLLECTGASGMQKGMFIFMEAMFIGSISILTGTLMGSVLFTAAWNAARGRIQAKLLLSGPIQFRLNGEIIIAAVICGCAMVLMACMVPVYKASACTAAELLQSAGEKDFKKFKAGKYNKKKSAEYNLALRNLQYGRDRNRAAVLILAAAVVVVLNGSVWIHMSEGDYLLKDRREKLEPDKWVSIYSEDTGIYERAFENVRRINTQGNTQAVSSLAVGSVVFPKDILNVENEEFTLYGGGAVKLPGQAADVQGREASGYGFDTVIVGLDEESFGRYARKIGVTEGELKESKTKELPFIIENYLLTDESGKQQYGSVMGEKQGKMYAVSFSKYGDLDMASAPRVDVLVNTDIFVIGATGTRPDIPILAEDYEYHVKAQAQAASGTIYLYTCMDKFNELIKKKEFRDMIGVHPQETAAERYAEYNEVDSRIYFSAADGLTDSEWREQLSRALGSEHLLYVKGGEDSGSGTWTFNSRKLIDAKKKGNPAVYFRKSFYYGVLLMAAAFVLSGMFQYMLMGLLARKREFSALESLGMPGGKIYRMICIENIIPALLAGALGIAAGMAGVLAQFSEAGKYRAVEMSLPWGAVFGSMIVLLLFSAAVLVAGGRISRGIDLTDALKNE